VHPGFRPVHAKGFLLAGAFNPTSEAAALSRAPHFHAPSTPVVLRFSDFAGIPAVADNDPNFSSPHGCAIRFQLGAHTHTDIVAHSADGFPVRTAAEFAEFLHALHASGPDVPHPTPIEQFLGSHPKALAFVQMPKPIPTSFAKESYFSVTAYKFIDGKGASHHVRYRILPDAGNEYLDSQGAAAKGPNFLMEELAERVATAPIKMNLWVQVAEEGDVVDDATVHWPAERRQILLGVITLTGLVPKDDPEGARIIFDPIPRVDGIEPSADPLLEPRADTYLMSGRRRRAAAKQ
jgi:catalase